MPSKQVIWLTLVAAVITIIVPLMSVGETVFKFIRPTSYQYLIVGIVVAGYFITTESAKLLYYKYIEKGA
jgi:uncharacterized membrane protein YGL010W